MEEIIDFITENVAPITVAVGFFALAPPALPMFPPLGAPQPGGAATDGGAGSLPSVASAFVRKHFYLIAKYHSHIFYTVIFVPKILLI